MTPPIEVKNFFKKIDIKSRRNAAIAAGWGDKPPAAAVIASNLKFIRKNTLIATADLTIPRWRLVIRGALWCTKNEKEWVGLPAREWIDRNGDKKFATILEFTDRETAARFQIAALNAVRAIAGASQ
jgi:hypothetical protein